MTDLVYRHLWPEICRPVVDGRAGRMSQPPLYVWGLFFATRSNPAAGPQAEIGGGMAWRPLDRPR